METAFAGCSSAEANTFLLNQALCKDFHSIFKFSAMERYPFCARFAVVQEKNTVCGVYANTPQNPFT